MRPRRSTRAEHGWSHPAHTPAGFTIADGLIGGAVDGATMASVVDPSWGAITGFAAAPATVGLAVHAAMSLALGLVFARVAHGAGFGLMVAATLGALALWAILHLLVLPVVDPVAARRLPYWLFALAHVAYGLGLGYTLAWRANRRITLGR